MLKKWKNTERQSTDKKDKDFLVAMFSGVFVMLFITVISLAYFQKQINRVQILEEMSEEYKYHYAFITGSNQESFFQTVYEGAKQRGDKDSIYVEYMGKNLAVSYSREELMKIAINANVNGIIIEANESEEMIQLINEAAKRENPIPVVTVASDSTGSMRKSFVGISYYNLGQKYGEQVLMLARQKNNKVLVLMKQDLENSNQNIILSGIKEILEKKHSSEKNFLIETKVVSAESSFSAEESIRDIFIEPRELPDILICLDELTTTCVYQAVVDYNKVGDVVIIGYYNSTGILNAVRKNIISGTAAVDMQQMGAYCVEALEEYYETGYVSEYMIVDITMITSENVKEYVSNEERQE